MKWIYFHRELHEYDIPCPNLLQVIERSISEFTPSGHEKFLDKEVLRDLCGCLITVTDVEGVFSESLVRSVSFAHYTVSEFLNSARIMDTPAAFFAVKRQNTKMELTGSIIREAVYADTNHCLNDIDGNFNAYCIPSSLNCVHLLGPDISKQDDLRSLTFGLFNHSKPYFSFLKIYFSAYLTTESIESGALFGPAVESLFHATWNYCPEIDAVFIFTHLLVVDKSCKLAAILPEVLTYKRCCKLNCISGVSTFWKEATQ